MGLMPPALVQILTEAVNAVTEFLQLPCSNVDLDYMFAFFAERGLDDEPTTEALASDWLGYYEAIVRPWTLERPGRMN